MSLQLPATYTGKMSREDKESPGIASELLHKNMMSNSTKVENWLQCIENSNNKTDDGLSVASYSSGRSSNIEKKLEKMFNTNDHESEKNSDKKERENNSERSSVPENLLDILLTPDYIKNKRNKNDQKVKLDKDLGTTKKNLLPLFSKCSNNCGNVPKTVDNEVLLQKSDSETKTKRSRLFNPKDVPYFSAILKKSRTKEKAFGDFTRKEKHISCKNNETLKLPQKKCYKYEEWRKPPFRKLIIDTSNRKMPYKSENAKKNFDKSKIIETRKLGPSTSFSDINKENSTHSLEKTNGNTQHLKKIANSKEENKDYTVPHFYSALRDKFNKPKKDETETGNNIVQKGESQMNYNYEDETIKFAKSGGNNKTKENQNKWPSVKKLTVDTNFKKNLHNQNNQEIKENWQVPLEHNFNKNIEEETSTLSTSFSNKVTNQGSTTFFVENKIVNNQQLRKIAKNKEENNEYKEHIIRHFDAAVKRKSDNPKIENNKIGVQNKNCQTSDNKKDRTIKFLRNAKKSMKWPVKELTVDTNFNKNPYNQNSQEIKEIKEGDPGHSNKNVEKETLTTSTLSSSKFFEKPSTSTSSGIKRKQQIEQVNSNDQKNKKQQVIMEEHNYQKPATTVIVKSARTIEIISRVVIRPSHECLCRENDFGKMMMGGFLNLLKHNLQYHPDQVNNNNECVEIYNILKRCFARN